MGKAEDALRREIVARAREMNAAGINQGTSGNISARLGDRMMITPSGVPYETMEPGMIASVALDDPEGAWEGPLRPSTEWRFHQRLLNARPDAQAVVHAHPAHCTALAILRHEIPACHYMVAAFGGENVRCAGYARFGSAELADLAVAAMAGRTACLLANHGMIVLGDTLARAMWRAVELEALARQYWIARTIGQPVILGRAEIDEALAAFADYGLKA
ncbi:class II aldolase/adducin family protein [Limibaculum sp. FT325]|uniref:class II aldolase/adducin family protein n=1 Tax=Thermohalobaculum sediminis TaxID=2939436 RepID=UPI0020BFC53F|nr:class II aldolase/adducin family protein [Limibaculum sediminis]MCL5775987.1 class II aldolase/adducin family protein [Limibaculum sediminis]